MNPVIGGEGGIPAGCQVDANGNIFVADMRHGLIKFDPKTKSFEQVRFRFTIIVVSRLQSGPLQTESVFKTYSSGV